MHFALCFLALFFCAVILSLTCLYALHCYQARGEGGGLEVASPELLRQKEEYERRGISLAHFDGNRKQPHLIALDRDPFRNKRLIYVRTILVWMC